MRREPIIAAIFFGLTAKQFYTTKGLYGAALSDHKIARWEGRLMFVAGSAVFLLLGLKYFFFDIHQ
jgi:hypothetical protein